MWLKKNWIKFFRSGILPYNTLNNPGRSLQLQQDVQTHLLAFLTSKICKNDVSDMHL